MDIIWDGITRVETLNDWAADARQATANHGKARQWPQLLALLAEHPEFVNSSRPGEISRYAPLHQAAYGDAPVAIIRQLLALGAWRTLQNAHGERPVDVARRRGHLHLVPVLQPEYRREVPIGILLRVQRHFHAVIRERADAQVEEHALRLPELEPLLEMEQPKVWFAVPGMYGGFSYWLQKAGVEPKLVSESWTRVVDGSGERHRITPKGNEAVG